MVCVCVWWSVVRGVNCGWGRVECGERSELWVG